MMRIDSMRWLATALVLVVAVSVCEPALGGAPDSSNLPPRESPNWGDEEAYVAFSPNQSSVCVGEDTWINVLLIGDWPDNLWVKIGYDPSALEVLPTDWWGMPMAPGNMHAHNQVYFEASFGASGEMGFYSDVPSPGDAVAPGLKGLAGTWVAARFHVRALKTGTTALTFLDGRWGSEGIVPIYSFDVTGAAGSVVVAPPATATPTPTATPNARVLHGTVRDAWDNPVPNAQLSLYRDNNGAWQHKATGPSGSDGVFRLYTNAIPGDWKLIMHPPAGQTAQSAALPDGVTGEVVSADTLLFTLGDDTGQIGPFAFVVESLPTSTPTPSPAPTLPPVVLAGHVTLGGQPLAGVDVTLSPDGLNSVQTTTTDAEGYYAFTASPGVYTLSVHDPEGRIADQARVIDTDAWDPGPIDWGTWLGWLPMVMVNK